MLISDWSSDVCSSDLAGAIAGTATPIAVQGDTLPFAPDHTVVTSLTYNLPLSPEIGSIDVGATYVYTGKRRSSASGSSPDDVLAPFDLLNLNINWYSLFNSSFDLSLFGTTRSEERRVGKECVGTCGSRWSQDH